MLTIHAGAQQHTARAKRLHGDAQNFKHSHVVMRSNFFEEYFTQPHERVMLVRG